MDVPVSRLGLVSAAAAGIWLATVLHPQAHQGHGHRGLSAVLDSIGAAPSGSAESRAVSYARAQLGKPYIWGGTGPDGFDCSGLAMEAWRSAGVGIARTSQQQWATLRHIRRSQLQPADLIFYAGSDGTVASPGHVVIYIGHGRVIQAYGNGVPVEVTPLDDVRAGGLTGYADPAVP
jgi:cell wall-associated NlpC family hydrolase